MTTPGRKDPCQCGSGKKYKDCHGDANLAPSPAAHLHALDEEVLKPMLEYAKERFPDRLRVILEEYEVAIEGALDMPEHSALVSAWCVHESRFKGRRLVDWYLAERRATLSLAEAGWLEAQARSWLSVWDVVEVTRGTDCRLRDCLTGETRLVTEVKATLNLDPCMAVLARIVDHDGFSVMCGLHPNPLGPTAAAAALRSIRKGLRIKSETIPIPSLREKDPLTTIRVWHQAVLADRARPAPRLQNTDGDPLDLVEDRFVLADPAGMDAIEDLLAGDDDIVPPEDDADEVAYTFLRRGNKMHATWENTVIGRLVLDGSSLRLETNSANRADALRRRLESLCGSLISFRSREHKDVEAMLAAASAAPTPGTAGFGRDAHGPPDSVADSALAAVALEWKRKHYGSWPDTPVPALGNKTPRQAAASPSLRPDLDVILKEIELAERREPAAARYDVGELRAELGL